MTGTADGPPEGVGYICCDCVWRLGGLWPKGHVATWHEGECDVCHERKSLANIGDWDWPDGRTRGMRD